MKKRANIFKVIVLASLMPVLSSCIVVDVSEMAKAVGQEAEARNNKYNPIFAGLEISGTIQQVQYKPSVVIKVSVDDMPALEAALGGWSTNRFAMTQQGLYVYQQPPTGIKVGDKVCKDSGSYAFKLC
jgi:hypothetical protein